MTERCKDSLQRGAEIGITRTESMRDKPQWAGLVLFCRIASVLTQISENDFWFHPIIIRYRMRFQPTNDMKNEKSHYGISDDILHSELCESSICFHLQQKFRPNSHQIAMCQCLRFLCRKQPLLNIFQSRKHSAETRTVIDYTIPLFTFCAISIPSGGSYVKQRKAAHTHTAYNEIVRTTTSWDLQMIFSRSIPSFYLSLGRKFD